MGGPISGNGGGVLGGPGGALTRRVTIASLDSTNISGNNPLTYDNPRWRLVGGDRYLGRINKTDCENKALNS